MMKYNSDYHVTEKANLCYVCNHISWQGYFVWLRLDMPFNALRGPETTEWWVIRDVT